MELRESPGAEMLREELGQVLGPGEGWAYEPLVHNLKNGVTRELARVRLRDRSAVLKVLTAHGEALPRWRASEESSHWNYWRREALVYEHDLPGEWRAAGVGAPVLLGLFERPGDDVALWLEDVGGLPGTRWTLAHHRRAGYGLGRAQGAYLAGRRVPDQAWLSSGFLRSYSDSKDVRWELLDDDEVWALPLIRRSFPAGLRDRMARLRDAREHLLSIVEGGPAVLCHLDVWPRNLFAREGDDVLVDWSFAGHGAAGEDVGNLIPDSVFDDYLAPELLPDLDAAVFSGYVAGLRDAGWRGDEAHVRAVTCASGIKYDWLLPYMLERALTNEHRDYGEGELASPEERYRVRGLTLDFVGRWADEALDLAARLGL